MEQKKAAVPMTLTIGIMSLFFLSMALGSISPAMNKMVEYYGERGISLTTVMYVTSLPQLVSVVGSLIAGVVAGKKLPFKACGLIGIILILVGGVTPTFVSSFGALLGTRMLFGAGFGFVMVLGNPLVAAYFSGDQKAKILSIGTFVTYGGAVVMQVLCGVLADIGLRYAFLTHLVAIVPLVLVIFFLKEPPRQQVETEQKKEKISLPGRVVFLAVMFGLLTMFVMPLYINLAVFVAEVNSQATVAAAVSVLYSVGNMIGAASFALVYKFCRRFTMAIYCFFMGAGLLIMLSAGSLPLMCAAMLISGFGYGGLMPTCLMITGLVTKPSQTAFATSIIFVGMNVLGFMATPYATLVGNVTGDSLRTPVFLGMIIIFVIGVFLMVVNPFPGKKQGAKV